ncbi:hypothetical protein BLSTO_01726 [Blastocystis sp. subtype 1]
MSEQQEVQTKKPASVKRPANKMSRSRLCFEWTKTGTCKHGDKCKFVHGDISEAINLPELKGRNRSNQELLRQQCEIRQSVKNREDLLNQYNEIHLDNFKLSKSCMIDRYYTQLYAADTNGCKGNDVSICMHSNTICIVSLAFGHEILTKGKKCVKVEFGVKLMTGINQGKRKKGGIWVDETTILCEITCDDGSVYKIPSCIRARLAEVNSRLLEEPNLLNEKPRTDGYIGLFIPKVGDVMNIQKSLLMASDYIRFFKERQEKEMEAELPA